MEIPILDPIKKKYPKSESMEPYLELFENKKP
jgi:hypothetical protein